MRPSDDEVAKRLSAILEAPEFQEQLTDKALGWLSRLLAPLKPLFLALGPFMPFVLAALSLGLVVYILVNVLGAFRSSGSRSRRQVASSSSNASKVEVTPDALYQRAKDLAQGGSVRDAARTLQHAFFLRLCLSRGVHWRETWSDWQWVAALGATPELVAFTENAQRVAFGTHADVAALVACFEQYEAFALAASS